MKAKYIERVEKFTEISNKIKKGEKLTQKELDMVDLALTDPLQEFCIREGTFRLVEIFNTKIEIANSLEDEAAEAIRDNIDTNEDLYDSIDYSLRYEVLGDRADRKNAKA